MKLGQIWLEFTTTSSLGTLKISGNQKKTRHRRVGSVSLPVLSISAVHGAHSIGKISWLLNKLVKYWANHESLPELFIIDCFRKAW